METDSTYAGWANYETWAIALQLSNDYSNYTFVTDFMREKPDRKHPYTALMRATGMYSDRVLPGSKNMFTFGTRKADRVALDALMRDLIAD